MRLKAQSDNPRRRKRSLPEEVKHEEEEEEEEKTVTGRHARIRGFIPASLKMSGKLNVSGLFPEWLCMRLN